MPLYTDEERTPPFPGAVWLDHWVMIMDVDPATTPVGWFVRWLTPHHRHVWAIGQQPDGTWSSLDAQVSRCLMEHGEVGNLDVVESYIERGCTAVHIAHWHDSRRVWIRGWLTCVSLTKYLTGFRCWWALTPRQLLREAERRGYTVRRPPYVLRHHPRS